MKVRVVITQLIFLITLNKTSWQISEQKLYLQDLQKLIAENNKDNSSEEDELEETVLSMQKTVEKLYEEYFSLSENSDARDNLVSLVQSVESSAHIRGLEFEKHRKSFEQIREKQENSEERKT